MSKKIQTSPLAHGFTLIEIMVALVIGILLLGGIIVIFIAGQNAIREAQDLSRVQENLRFASDFLVRDVRNSGFRDEANLTVDDWESIGTNYINIGDDFLEVRYAGRGSCSEKFSDITVVTNRYEVEDGVLLCNSRRLVSGVIDLTVTPIYPNGIANEECPGNCIGTLLELTLDGGAAGPSMVALRSIFRNRVLDILYSD